jgi:hypothetical protein
MCLNIVWCGGLCLALAWLIFVWAIGLTSTSLFVLGAATGLVFAPLFPLSFGLFNQKLNVVPMLLALLLCGTALGGITFQKIAGKIYLNKLKEIDCFWILFRLCNGRQSKSFSDAFNYLSVDVNYFLCCINDCLFSS